MPAVEKILINEKLNFQGEVKSDFELRKEAFLDKMRSPNGKARYKRYLGSPLRYAGGKSLAVGKIVEHLPNNINRIISPFFGGGSFEIACSKEIAIPVIGFDIFDILVNYWQVQISEPEKLAEELKKFSATNDGFKEVKERLKKHWENTELIENKIILAAHYYYNHNTSYGPGFLSWPSSVYMQEKRYISMIEKVRSTKLSNLKVLCDSFENVIPKYKNDFLYCDPPYYLKGDSKMFKGIYPQRNFPVHHNSFDHNKLRDLLIEHKADFILSYNDCSDIRKMYKDFKIIDVSWQYTMGQGETRIGLNRKNDSRGHTKKSHEILIVKKQRLRSNTIHSAIKKKRTYTKIET